MTRSPSRLSPAACARWLFDELGVVRLALPLGLGKAEAIANALYRQACADKNKELHIYTALSLEVPAGSSELERRFFGPLSDGLFRNVPSLEFIADFRSGKLPENVTVTEFFFRPGAWLGHPLAQQQYTSINYTHVARDLLSIGVNVIAQRVAFETVEGEERFSLSCNPDVSLDLYDLAAGSMLLVGEICDELPFMEGDAALAADRLDAIVEPEHQSRLFPVPNEPVGITEHAIALRAAALVKDGGTLQIGIGGLGDAVAHALVMRHVDNETFQALAVALDIEGELAPFESGLYGASEMFVEGFLELRKRGVLKRTVRDGVYLHGGFFLGSRQFYDALRDMDRDDRDGIHMSRISFTNQLLIDESQKRRERVHGRFMNTAMMVTLSGAVVSDGLEDGRVVSGVGGQFNFVAMAHELEDGRSIIMLPATRTSGGKVSSNIVWNYGHTTIPRHLRDIVVTEYGVADLRGKSDKEVIARLLSITDSRFQEELRRKAVDAGKLPADFEIPRASRQNSPGALRDRMRSGNLLARLPHFPLGSDFDEAEALLAVGLSRLRKQDWQGIARMAIDGFSRAGDDRIQPALERMALASPSGWRERLFRAVVAGAVNAVLSEGRPLDNARLEPE